MRPIIDEEFRKLIPPLSEEEFDQLEKNIVEDGEVYEPIILWNGIVIDGHNRLKIIDKHPEIPFRTFDKSFETRDEVIEWMCSKQLGRRNLTDVQKTLLIAEMFEARKRTERDRDEKGKFLPQPQNEALGKTSVKLAEEQGISKSAVERAAEFRKGLLVADEVSPGIKERIVNGELLPTKQDVASLRNLDGEELEDAVRQIERGEKVRPYYKETPCATQIASAKPYDINDFREELRGKVIALDQSLDLTCRLVHSDMLATQEGKDALSDALLGITEVVKKYMELT